MQLIGLHGRAKCGKDTVASYIKLVTGYETYAFADPLKRAASEMFGIPLVDFYNQAVKDIPNAEWGISPRQILQQLGTEGGRILFRDDIWIKRAQIEIKNSMCSGTTGFIVTDIRFENEADMIRDAGGVVVHVFRDTIEKVQHHSSEGGIKVNADDSILHNGGTIQQLYDSIDQLMRDL